jgi:molybdopterin converting factor small subunit
MAYDNRKAFRAYKHRKQYQPAECRGRKDKLIIDEIVRQCPGISRDRLLQSVMFINKEQVNVHKVLARTLKDGDELVLISPSSGG